MAILKPIGRSVEAVVVGSVVAVGIAAMMFAVSTVIGRELPAETRADVECLFGVADLNTPEGAACMGRQVRALEEEQRRRREQDRLVHEARMAEAAEALAEIERRARAAMSTTQLLYQRLGEVDGRYILMATAYEDPATRTGFIGRWCFAAQDTGGPDPRLLISTYDATGAVTDALQPGGQDPQGFGLSPAGVAEARRLCDVSPSGS